MSLSRVFAFSKLRLNTPAARFAWISALSQLFPLCALPFLARLYTPQAFGEYALYYALTTICGVVAPLSMQYAVLTQSDDRDADATALFACAVALLMCPLIAVLPTVLVGLQLVPSNSALPATLMWALPMSTAVSVVYQVGYNWMLRHGQYQKLGTYKLLLASVTALVQVAIGFAGAGVLGLVLANLFGFSLAAALTWHHILPRLRVNPLDIRAIAAQRRHLKQLALYTTPASLVNAVALYLPEFILGRFYGTGFLGQYAMAQRLIAAPLSFISSTLQDVFRSEVARELREQASTYQAFGKFLKLLVLIVVCMMIPLIIVAPWLFELVLGSQWGVAGSVVQAMAVLSMLKFIAAPLSFVQFCYKKLKFDLFWQAGLIALTSAGLLLPIWAGMHHTRPVLAMFVLAALLAGWYVVSLAYSFYLSRSNHAAV